MIRWTDRPDLGRLLGPGMDDQPPSLSPRTWSALVAVKWTILVLTVLVVAAGIIGHVWGSA